MEIRRPAGEADRRRELMADARRGLLGPRKELPPKWFYDARGSRLFERITRLPEYYQTRTERRILDRVAPSLVAELGSTALVELGAGSAEKTRALLDAMSDEGRLHAFAAIDVSGKALEETARRLAREYPGVHVVAVVADFERPIELPFAGERRLVIFLGSTIGNLVPSAARSFLASLARQLGPEDGLLVGFDLVKDRGRLEAAYDDAAGVTAEFNRNVLHVLNRELEADFDPASFRHRAFYAPEEARIEMHLVSERDQTVRLGALGLEVPFRRGETIRTELSHKYTRESVEALLASAGLALARWETDPEGLFALGLARPASG